MSPCVNRAGEIVTYTIPWLQECIDREKGLVKSKNARRPRGRAWKYELIHRAPDSTQPNRMRWSIKITKPFGKVEWIDDYHEKADAEAEIIRLRDRFDANWGRVSERYSAARGEEQFARDGSYSSDRQGIIDDPRDEEWN